MAAAPGRSGARLNGSRRRDRVEGGFQHGSGLASRPLAPVASDQLAPRSRWEAARRLRKPFRRSRSSYTPWTSSSRPGERDAPAPWRSPGPAEAVERGQGPAGLWRWSGIDEAAPATRHHRYSSDPQRRKRDARSLTAPKEAESRPIRLDPYWPRSNFIESDSEDRLGPVERGQARPILLKEFLPAPHFEEYGQLADHHERARPIDAAATLLARKARPPTRTSDPEYNH